MTHTQEARTTGRWSLVRVAATAEISHRVARTLATAGYLDPKNLTGVDVLRARVAAALLDAPRPAGAPRPTSVPDPRWSDARRHIDKVYADPASHTEALLVILPDEVVPARKPSYLGMLADENPGQPVLSLPIGTWVTALLADNTPNTPPPREAHAS